jgi:catechol 2,3-dioxygenase-like lactoylglutathione lyase family enzyme
MALKLSIAVLSQFSSVENNSTKSPLKAMLFLFLIKSKVSLSTTQGTVMVRLEHVNLVMQDIQPTLDFLLIAFPHWKIRGEGDMVWGRAENAVPRHWLHVGDDDYYLTLNDNAQGEIRNVSSTQAGVAHLGFIVDDLEELILRLATCGFTVDISGQSHPFRQTVYYNDPAGFQFEFLQYGSDKPEEKNMYGGESGQVVRKYNDEK